VKTLTRNSIQEDSVTGWGFVQNTPVFLSDLLKFFFFFVRRFLILIHEINYTRVTRTLMK
jgi:hypothetical protein